MTIHSEHPFLPPPQDRRAVRRLRGRLAAPVTVWATGTGTDRAGLTVSSLLVADGEPGEVVALVDPDSDFGEQVVSTRVAAVSVLAGGQQQVADVLAGLAPSPGGPFRTGEWSQSDWGPVLIGAAAWAGVRLLAGEPVRAGWGLLLRAVLERVEVPAEHADQLVYLRGRYRVLGTEPGRGR